MRSVVRRIGAVACVAVFLCGSPFSRAASPVRDGASRLLEIAEKNTPPAVAAARAQYEQLKKANPDDARIDYVYGVALVNQHLYGEALPLVARYLARHADDGNAIRTKIWIELHDRQYAPALKDAVGLSRLFPKRSRAKPNPEFEEAARFLGAVFGYLELARPEAVDEKLRSASKNQVLSALGDAYLSAFEEGRQKVADRLAELDKEQKEKQDRAAETLDERQGKVKEAIADDRQKIAAGNETVQASAEQLRDAQRQLAVLSTQLNSLEKDRARLSAQIVTVQTHMFELQRDVKLDSKRTPTVSIDTAAKLAQLSVILASLDRQAFAMDEKILALRTQAAQLGAKGNKESQTLAANRAAVGQVERRAKALENQVRRLEAKRPVRRAPTAEMKKFSTYLSFPFEEEKQRVLGWFEE